MLLFLLSCLLNLSVGHAAVIALPAQLRNGTELLDIYQKNTTSIRHRPDLTSSAGLLGNPIDERFRTTIHMFPDVRISGKSTYMNILKAMIQLSYSEATHAYTGETFSFPSYTNVKIRITRVTSSSSTLQYRYALWGLYEAADYLTTISVFSSIQVDLYWSGGGVPAQVGVIEIFPDPLPNIAESKDIQNLIGISQRVETPPSSPDVAKFASIDSNETNLAATTYAGRFSVFVELQGEILSISEVFMTLFLAVVDIASFGTAAPMHDFVAQDGRTKMELVYEHYDAPRTSPPFFTYHAAARALGYIPEYMFEQRRFEALVFVVEVGGVPVGTGFLRKYSMTSSITSDKT